MQAKLGFCGSHNRLDETFLFAMELISDVTIVNTIFPGGKSVLGLSTMTVYNPH